MRVIKHVVLNIIGKLAKTVVYKDSKEDRRTGNGMSH